MNNKNIVSHMKQHLMTGTSFMIPFVVAGGILFAMSVMLSGEAAVPESGWLAGLNQIGAAGLALFIPALGGYIAYSISDKPGIAPGFIGAYLANEVGAGFLGGIVAGFIAGYTVYYLKKIKLRSEYRTIGTIFIYPLVGTLVVGIAMVFFIGYPIAGVMTFLTEWLNNMSGAAKVPLGGILGAMTAFDMGGPINKVACTFAQTQVNTLPYLMGGVGVAICVPPLGLGLATLLFPKKFSPAERDSGKASILMGCVGITEGAIPFATADPVRVIPSLVVGSVVGNIMAFLFGCLNHAPWGGLIVLPVVEGKLGYLISVICGAIVVAVLMGILKPKYNNEDLSTVSEEFDLDFEQL